MNKKTFLKNAVAVSAVSLIMSTVGMLFKTYASNRIGSEAMGLLQLILSVYYPACTFASSGIYVASTRMNSEALARRDRNPKNILTACMIYSLMFGTAAFCILFFGAEPIAVHLLRHPEAVLPLKILSFGLPFLSVANGLQGFFLALRNAVYSTFLQVSEDLFKILATMLLFSAFLEKGMEAALCAMVAGMAIGEILSCLSGYVLSRGKISKYPVLGRKNSAPVLPEILKIALPCAFSAYLRSGIGMVENIIVPRGLERSGLTAEQTLSALGKLEGMALPVLTFPAAFLAVVSKLLVPELTAENALGHQDGNKKTITSVLRWTLTYGLFLSVFALLFGRELGIAIYHDPVCGLYITVLAPLLPILYCDSVTDGMMKGYNQQLASMKINLTDTVLRTCAAWFFLPLVGIPGYIVLMYASSGFNFILSIRTLLKSSGASFPFAKGVLLPGLAALASFLPMRILGTFVSVSVWLKLLAGLILYPVFLMMLSRDCSRCFREILRKRRHICPSSCSVKEYLQTDPKSSPGSLRRH